ncbi:MobA/MobL family protein [Sphingobium sp. LF-16]|uniref:MobA/MobL family protein n=1 Tax=Sphingobium sp. LF-16 TaxID=2185111 RepID=UPI000F08635D|nr:MobA/MobL family protein [Sphingobium sp. LF-16]
MVIAANIHSITDKVRRLIAINEREELVGSIRFGNFRRPIEHEKGKSGKGPFGRSVDFFMPVALPGRATMASGGSSFHCKFESVGRGGEVAGRSRKKSAASGPDKRKDAAGFEIYVAEQAVALESPAISSDQFERYAALAPSETQDELERSRVARVISNISSDPVVRGGFWKAVEQNERRASAPHVAFFPDRAAPAFWEGAKKVLADVEGVQAPLSKIIALQTTGSARSKRLRDRKPVRVECDAGLAASVLDRLSAIDGWDAHHPPVTIPRTRNGRVQNRWVFEIPVEIAAAPEALDRVLCSLAATFDRIGTMYTLVLHDPDADNDQRNSHVHVISHDRACNFIEAAAKWDIELSAAERKKYDVKLAKKRRPKMEADGAYWEAGARDIAQMRAHFADLCNAELEKLKVKRRLDPRNFAEAGMQRKPQIHMGPAAARLSKFGVATEAETENMYRSLHAELSEIEDRERTRFADRLALAQKMADVLAKADKKTDWYRHFDQTWDRLRDLLYAVKGAEAALETLTLFELLAKSRAELVQRNCDRMLAGIRSGKAKASIVRDQAKIERRRNEAVAHLQHVATTLAPYQPDRQSDERDVREMATEIEGILAEFRVELEKLSGRQQAGDRLESTPSVRPITLRWAALRERILRDKPVIIRTAEGFDVPTLDAASRALLRSQPLEKRAPAFLKSQLKIQDAEVGRLRAAIEAHGIDGLAGFPTAAALLQRYKGRPDVAALIAVQPAREAVVSEATVVGVLSPASSVVTVPETANQVAKEIVSSRASIREAGGVLPHSKHIASAEAADGSVSAGQAPRAKGVFAQAREIVASRSQPRKELVRGVGPRDRSTMMGGPRENAEPANPQAAQGGETENGIALDHGRLGEETARQLIGQPVPVLQPELKPDPARDAAVESLRIALLSDPAMRVVQENGRLKISPQVSGWDMTVDVFSDHPVIAAAMRERAASPWLDVSEAKRVEVARRAIAELKLGKSRTVWRSEQGWDVKLPDQALADTLSSWSTYKPISDLLALTDMYWSNRERVVSSAAPQLRRDDLAHAAPIRREHKAKASAPEADQDFAQLQALAQTMRDQRSR